MNNLATYVNPQSALNLAGGLCLIAVGILGALAIYTMADAAREGINTFRGKTQEEDSRGSTRAVGLVQSAISVIVIAVLFIGAYVVFHQATSVSIQSVFVQQVR